jgi:hypothetical protein
MATGRLLKTTRVLALWDTDCHPGHVEFAQVDEDDPRGTKLAASSLLVSREVWAEMGKPETITARIEVGDTLNPREG